MLKGVVVTAQQTGPATKLIRPVGVRLPRTYEGGAVHFVTWERALIALITGVIAFGAGTGNIWVAFPASVALVAAVLGLSSLPSHKGRDASARLGKRAGIVLAVAWGLIVCLAVLVLFLVPAQFTLTGGVLTAFVAAGAIWGAIAYVDRR